MKKLKTLELTAHIGTFMQGDVYEGMMCIMSDNTIEVVEYAEHLSDLVGEPYVRITFAGRHTTADYLDMGIPVKDTCRSIKGVIDRNPTVEREELKADPNILIPTNVPDVKFKDALANLWLDWRNNFLTIERFAAHYGLTEKEAEHLINIGRALQDQRSGE